MADVSSSFQVVIFTRSHIINGEITLHDQRLSDHLNDKRATMLELRYASVQRLNDPGRTIATFYKALVPKKSVVLAFHPPQKDAPPARRFIGMVKEKHEVLVVIDGAELRGTMHTSGPLDAQQIITSLSESFLPITAATVSLAINPKATITNDTVLVSVPEIRFIGELLSSSPTQPRKPEGPPPQ